MNSHRSYLLFTEVTHHTPVGFRDCEPFAVSWSDVDVDSTEVVVFLVTWETNANLRLVISWGIVGFASHTSPHKNLLWFFLHYFPPIQKKNHHTNDFYFVLECVITWYSAARDFHVQLNRVHPQDGVAHMAEQVSSRHDSSEGRQFTQLLQLLLPPGGESGQSSALACHQLQGGTVDSNTHFLSSETSMLVPNLMCFNGPLRLCTMLQTHIHKWSFSLMINTVEKFNVKSTIKTVWQLNY